HHAQRGARRLQAGRAVPVHGMARRHGLRAARLAAQPRIRAADDRPSRRRGHRDAAGDGARAMTRRTVIGLLAVLIVIGAFSYSAAEPFVTKFLANRECCAVPFLRNVVVTRAELRGDRTYAGEIGQDKWVLETVFPDVTNGFFLDVGSGHGTIGSNSVML